jgi:hypothetical protein
MSDGVHDRQSAQDKLIGSEVFFVRESANLLNPVINRRYSLSR